MRAQLLKYHVQKLDFIDEDKSMAVHGTSELRFMSMLKIIL